MPAQRRGRAGLAYRSPQRGQDGIRLPWPGNDHRDMGRRQKRRDREGEGVSGHVLDPIETGIVELLGTAGLVEPDDLHLHRVEKVGDGWIVEGEMTVLADPGTDDVGGFGQKRVFVCQTGLERPVAAFAGYQAHLALT